MKSCIGSSWILFAVVAAGPLAGAEPAWNSLLGNSPFGAAPANATTAAPGAPEFRGFFTEGGEQYFSVYDPARRRAFWLCAGQADAGLRVRSFDPARQVLAVEINGQVQALPLKVAAVLAEKPATTSISSPVPSTAANPARAPGPTTDAVTKAEETLARAQQLAAYELRRKQVLERRQARTTTRNPNKQ